MRHLSAPFARRPGARRGAGPLRPLHGAVLAGSGWAIVSASPERFLWRGRLLSACPIKGTRPAGVPDRGVKDAAEHVMIVDLERNDLWRVCERGRCAGPS